MPTHKSRTRPVMISSDSTVVFAPVHGDQEETRIRAKETGDEPKTETEAPKSAAPRILEVKPAPRIVPRRKLEILHVTEP